MCPRAEDRSVCSEGKYTHADMRNNEHALYMTLCSYCVDNRDGRRTHLDLLNTHDLLDIPLESLVIKQRLLGY